MHWTDWLSWFTLAVSIVAIFYLGSKTDTERKIGFLLTALARLSGGLVFVYFDLWPLVIGNAIYVVLSARGYANNMNKENSNGFWKYFVKAMGDKAFEEDEKADRVAVLRMFWVLLHVVTCCFIIAAGGRTLGLW